MRNQLTRHGELKYGLNALHFDIILTHLTI